jgi:hypothetical protein
MKNLMIRGDFAIRLPLYKKPSESKQVDIVEE